MFLDKFAKKAVTSASKAIKEKANEKVNDSLPVIIGVSAVLVALFTIMAPSKQKVAEPLRTTVVNNFYIGGTK